MLTTCRHTVQLLYRVGRTDSCSLQSYSAAVPGGKLGAVPKPKMTVREAMSFLAASHQIRCLALMALAQGISTNLIDVRGPRLLYADLGTCLIMQQAWR